MSDSFEHSVARLDDLIARMGLSSGPAPDAVREPEVSPLLSPPSTPVPVRLSGLVPASDIDPERYEFLWPFYIPTRELTVFEGPTGLGKTMVTIDLAARVTTGRPMPLATSGRAPATVLYLSSEDDMSRVLVPRLIAAEADRTKVQFLEDSTLFVDTSAGLKRLREYIDGTGSVLVVLDNLLDYLSPKVNPNRNDHVRQALGPLRDAVREMGCAVVAVRHFRKGLTPDPLQRGLGATAIGAVARSVLQVDRPDASDRDRRVLAQAKLNEGPEAPGLEFRIVPSEYDPTVGVVRWEGVSDLQAHDLAEPNGQTQQGPVDVLRRFLSGGSKPERECLQALSEAGFEYRSGSGSTYRLRSKAGVGTTKDGFGSGWVWHLN